MSSEFEVGPRAKNDSLPKDDLVQLEVAFNMLGRHQFGGDWRKDMAHRVRLGRGAQLTSEADKMARWALRALRQCVENGWLPLFYFQGEHPVQRIEYYRSPQGVALHALYPRPTDENEDGGYIELDDGAIYPCMVNVGDFDAVLREKFGSPPTRRGPKRQFAKYDAALDMFFETHPLNTPAKDVTATLNRTFKGETPKPTTRYNRIDEARQRAIDRVRLKTPDETADG